MVFYTTDRSEMLSNLINAHPSACKGRVARRGWGCGVSGVGSCGGGEPSCKRTRHGCKAGHTRTEVGHFPFCGHSPCDRWSLTQLPSFCAVQGFKLGRQCVKPGCICEGCAHKGPSPKMGPWGLNPRPPAAETFVIPLSYGQLSI